MLLSNDISPGHMDHSLHMNEDVEDEKKMKYFLCLLVWFLKCLAEYNNGINNGTKWFIKAKGTENIRWKRLYFRYEEYIDVLINNKQKEAQYEYSRPWKSSSTFNSFLTEVSIIQKPFINFSYLLSIAWSEDKITMIVLGDAYQT